MILSYCSKFSFHGRNLKNEDVRAKKPWMNSTLKTTLAQKIVLTAIFAQNQLIFVFRGTQPNMNMEITRQMDIKIS